MRFEWCVAMAGLAMVLGGGAAQAQAGPGRYGGGFIEFLMSDAPPSGPVRALGRPDGAAPRRLSSGDRVPEAMPQAPADVAPTRMRLAALPQADERVPVATSARPGAETIARTPDPRFARQVVDYDGGRRPGTIVVDTPTKFLYLVQPGGKAIRYGIGVGRPGFAWSGLKSISQKREWPDWTPPSEMIRRRPDLPRHMAGGPGNPLGARALYLGSSLYRIHGTNEPHTIGQSVSSGCIRMMNEDVIDLYERTPVGTRVEVL
ncbi:L,D-transpeptidase [Methylobacterium sp. J-090]|uniref:L,D-transpeptidase n=1 Tax=Methylobacterium sp. J-090 TaxID=2836666 RepID=UPI001FBA3EAB|nr:L,D-transpeptidase [Methylobacterium sp. J-090]MCJ2083740.1 L,D-transpeptidase [Methylobacterium sp. J-090]